SACMRRKDRVMGFGHQGGEWRGFLPGSDDRDAWSFPAGDREFFARLSGGARLFTWDALGLVIRGHARPIGSSGPLDLEAAAEEARAHYLEYGDLAVEGLEGSFTLALLDGHAGRVLLY